MPNTCGEKHSFEEYYNSIDAIRARVQGMAQSGDTVPVMPPSLYNAGLRVGIEYDVVFIGASGYVGISKDGDTPGLSETSWYIFKKVDGSAEDCCMAFKFDASVEAKKFEDLVSETNFDGIKLGTTGSTPVSYAELKAKYSKYEFYHGETLECDCIQHVFSFDRPTVEQSGFISSTKDYYGINPSISSASAIASLIFNGKVSSNNWVYDLKSDESKNGCVGDEYLTFLKDQPVSKTGFKNSITELKSKFEVTRYPCKEDASYLNQCMEFGFQKISDYTRHYGTCGDEYFNDGPDVVSGSYDINPTQVFQTKDYSTMSEWGWYDLVLPNIAASPEYFNVREKLFVLCMCGVFDDLRDVFDKIESSISAAKAWNTTCIPTPTIGDYTCFDAREVAIGANQKFGLTAKRTNITSITNPNWDATDPSYYMGVRVQTYDYTTHTPYYAVTPSEGCGNIESVDYEETEDSKDYYFSDTNPCILTPEGVDVCKTVKCKEK